MNKPRVCLLLLITTTVTALGQNDPNLASKPIYKQKPIGALSASEKAAYLKSIGDKKVHTTGLDPWETTDHQFGFLPFKPGDTNDQPIQSAHLIKPDTSLLRIDLRLDRLRIFDYPGSGKHFVMFTFAADNSVTDGMLNTKEAITFSQTYEAEEGQGAGVTGYPVFIGLTIGKTGAAFKGETINVKNEDDERALSFLKSGALNQGLSLLTTAQPAVAPFVELAKGIGEMLFSRNENRKVQAFYMGLDFDDGAAFGARLREGNYIVVQAPDNEFTWNDWIYTPSDARVVKKGTKSPMPYNYIIFRVTKHAGQ